MGIRVRPSADFNPSISAAKGGVKSEAKANSRTGGCRRWSQQRHRARNGSAVCRREAKVVVTGRSLPALDDLAHEIQLRGGDATSQVADVTQYEQMQALAERAFEVYSQIDTWVHVAAVSLYAPFQETKPDKFRRLIEVNLIGQAFSEEARTVSAYTTLELHPALRLGLLCVLTGVALVLLRQRKS